MTNALTRYADSLDDEARRLEVEILTTRIETLAARIEHLEAHVKHLTAIQDNLLATAIQQNKTSVYLTQRTDALAQSIAKTFGG